MNKQQEELNKLKAKRDAAWDESLLLLDNIDKLSQRLKLEREIQRRAAFQAQVLDEEIRCTIEKISEEKELKKMKRRKNSL